MIPSVGCSEVPIDFISKDGGSFFLFPPRMKNSIIESVISKEPKRRKRRGVGKEKERKKAEREEGGRKGERKEKKRKKRKKKWPKKENMSLYCRPPSQSQAAICLAGNEGLDGVIYRFFWSCFLLQFLEPLFHWLSHLRKAWARWRDGCIWWHSALLCLTLNV